MIIDGRIKLKSDSLLERFTKKGLKFQDGSELEADIVIFATG
jgi:NAD(P)H-nitrite reductase large subunit